MQNDKIIVGRKGEEQNKGSFLGPWVLQDYWPYVVNGVVRDVTKAREVAAKLNCVLPKTNPRTWKEN